MVTVKLSVSATLAFGVPAKSAKLPAHKSYVDTALDKAAGEAVAVGRAADQCRRSAAEHCRAHTRATQRKFVAVDGGCIHSISAVGKGDLDVTLRVEHGRVNAVTIGRAAEVCGRGGGIRSRR